MPADAPFNLPAKFQAMSRALRASFDAHAVGGYHSYEKGLRSENVLCDFLAGYLPPRYGVSRGEVVAATGQRSRQIDLVIYDALHAPLLQDTETSRIFFAESVYAAIELKPRLSRSTLAEAVRTIASVKALYRGATLEAHGGHRTRGGPQPNPPIFGAIFALKASSVPDRIVPDLADHHRKLVHERWIDCICVLDQALVYHFARQPAPPGMEDWTPTFLSKGAKLGYYPTKEDTLFVFCLFLLHQLTSKVLAPPDVLRYARGMLLSDPRIYNPGPEHP